MKTFKLFLLLSIFAMVLPAASKASVAVSTETARTEIIKKALDHQTDVKADAKMNQKLSKKIAKAEKRMAKHAQSVDFNDPVDKWMWFWIFGWGAGILFAILGWIVWPLWYISYLCWLFGTVSLVIWLVKKFGGV